MLSISDETVAALDDILTCTRFQGQKILNGAGYAVLAESMEAMHAANERLRKAWMADMQRAIDAKK